MTQERRAQASSDVAKETRGTCCELGEDTQASRSLPIHSGLEYRTLPSHRRLWSWGWSSTAATAPESEAHQGNTGSASTVAWTGRFPVGGGGTVIFTLAASSSFTIAICCQEDQGEANCTLPYLGVRIGSQSAELILSRDGNGGSVRVLASSHFPGAGFGRGAHSAFWLSFDPENRTIKYGKGCRMRERTFLTYTLSSAGLESLPPPDKQLMDRLFSHGTKLIQLQDYGGPQVIEHDAYEAPLMRRRAAEVASVQFDRTPLVLDPSPRLLDAQQMLLSDFDRRDYTFPANLSPIGQALSQQVLQPWLSLESEGEAGGPNLAQAIEYSLKTPGAFLYSLLQDKIASLPEGTPREQCHLSVALAPAAGSSPGPAFTLEILPSEHYIPAHDNANAHGVLRVLHGFLDVALFDSDLEDTDEGSPLDEVELDVGDAMWFSPAWYQTHAMRNDSSQYCCYLLARQYADDDCVRWPFIRSKAADGSVCSGRVVADCSFPDLHAAAMPEVRRALEANPELLKKPLSSEDLERSSSARTEAWVERTDSALDYTHYTEASEELTLADLGDGSSKQQRYRCGPFSGKAGHRPAGPPDFLLKTPAIPEEPASAMLLWP